MVGVRIRKGFHRSAYSPVKVFRRLKTIFYPCLAGALNLCFRKPGHVLIKDSCLWGRCVALAAASTDSSISGRSNVVESQCCLRLVQCERAKNWVPASNPTTYNISQCMPLLFVFHSSSVESVFDMAPQTRTNRAKFVTSLPEKRFCVPFYTASCTDITTSKKCTKLKGSYRPQDKM